MNDSHEIPNRGIDIDADVDTHPVAPGSNAPYIVGRHDRGDDDGSKREQELHDLSVGKGDRDLEAGIEVVR